MTTKRKARIYDVKTVMDMHVLSVEQLPAFCEDLRLWLTVHRLAEHGGMKPNTPTDVFGWIDDGKHDVKVTITVKQPTL